METKAPPPEIWCWKWFKPTGWMHEDGRRLYRAAFETEHELHAAYIYQQLLFHALKPTAACRHIIAEVNAGRATLDSFQNKTIN
jgi:hypothetical protein